MLKRRDFLRSLLIATGCLLVVLLATDGRSALGLKGFMRQFRGPHWTWIPVVPFVLAGVKIVLFYIVSGIVLGAVLYAVARVLASQRQADGAWVVPRQRYYVTFIAAVLIVTAYMHAHALLLYPALYDSSWRWAALAGSPTVVMAVGLLGKIAVVIVCLIMVQKRRETVVAWVRRWKRVVLAAVVLVGGVVGAWCWVSRPADVNRGPNIIILGLDAVRPDHVSALGYEQATGRQTTPNLDRFLEDSIAFTNAFVPLARTGPSWVSILTGCFPPKHGHRCDLAPKESRLPPVATLASHLQKLGYSTSFFIDNSNFMSMDPEMGFSHIEQPDPNVVWFGLSFFPLHLVFYYYGLNNPIGFYYAPMLRANQAFAPVYDPRHFARAINRHLVRMKGEKKFFLAAHTCIGHAPYCVCYPYSTYFSPPPPTPPNRFTFRWPFDRVLSEKEFTRRTSVREWPLLFSQEINLYDALLRESDEWLGAILQTIRRLDLYDNSLIIILSDHGEDLYRKDLAYRYLTDYPYLTSNHGFHVWGDDSYRALLAIKLPQSKNGGRRVASLVRSIDVAPTVLDALGLPPLAEAEGISLLPQIKDPEIDPHLSAYSEAGLSLKSWFVEGHRPYPFEHWVLFQYVDPESLHIYRKEEYMGGFVMTKDRALRDSRWKIIAYPMEGEPLPFKTTLHDVERDPTNLIDLASSEPAALAEMRSRLAPFIEADAQAYGFEWYWQATTTRTIEATSAPLGQQP